MYAKQGITHKQIAAHIVITTENPLCEQVHQMCQ